MNESTENFSKEELLSKREEARRALLGKHKASSRKGPPPSNLPSSERADKANPPEKVKTIEGTPADDKRVSTKVPTPQAPSRKTPTPPKENSVPHPPPTTNPVSHKDTTLKGFTTIKNEYEAKNKPAEFTKTKPQTAPPQKKDFARPVAPSLQSTKPKQDIKEEVPLPKKAEEVRERPESLADIAIARQRERGRQRKEALQARPKKFSWLPYLLALGIVVLVVGGGFLFYTTFTDKDVPPPLPPEITVAYPITPDQEVTKHNPESTDIAGTLAETLADGSGRGALTAILFLEDVDSGETQKQVSPSFVLSSLSDNTPQNLLRALSDSYMLGVYRDTQASGFLLFGVDSFQTGFGAMLGWEGDGVETLYQYLSLGGIDIKERETVWRDASVSNVDVRVLTDTTESTYLLYGFLDKNTLLIATSRDVFSDLLGRYLAPGSILQ